MFYPKILNKNQKEILGKLSFLKNKGFYSIEDIATMKIIALVQRGTKRDFIDFYFLLKEFSLAKLVKFTQKKYPNYDEMLILRALIFFEDAENETKKRPIKVFKKGFSWLRVKDYIFRQVKAYQLSFAKRGF